METFGEKAAHFYSTLRAPKHLPEGIECLNPYRKKEVKEIAKRFYTRFFSDTKERVFVIGINPGRLGSGITGIPFTDTAALTEHCGIGNELERKRELTATFVYEFIKKWGGTEKFYRDFYLTSACPVGFVRGKINFNYYDDPALHLACKSYILQMLKKQLAFGAKKKAILFGTGKNQKAFLEVNRAYKFFDEILPLEHPRFVAQYRRKQMDEYLEKYHDVFQQASKG